MIADLVVRNGLVVTGDDTFTGGVAITGGRIVAVGADDALPAGREVLDVGGRPFVLSLATTTSSNSPTTGGVRSSRARRSSPGP